MDRLTHLTEQQWKRLERLIPAASNLGRPEKSRRDMVEGIIWILRTGAPWRDLPPAFGPWQSVYTRFSRRSKRGFLENIFNALAEERDGEAYMIDGAIMRAHQDASGAPKKLADKRSAALAAVHRQSSTPSSMHSATPPDYL